MTFGEVIFEFLGPVAMEGAERTMKGEYFLCFKFRKSHLWSSVPPHMHENLVETVNVSKAHTQEKP